MAYAQGGRPVNNIFPNGIVNGVAPVLTPVMTPREHITQQNVYQNPPPDGGIRPEDVDAARAAWFTCCKEGQCIKNDYVFDPTLVTNGYEFPTLALKGDHASVGPPAMNEAWIPTTVMRNMMVQQPTAQSAHILESFGHIVDPQTKQKYDPYGGNQVDLNPQFTVDQNGIPQQQRPDQQRIRQQASAGNSIPDMAMLAGSSQEKIRVPTQRVDQPTPLQAPQQATMDQPFPSATSAPATDPNKTQKKKSNYQIMNDESVLKEAWWCSYCCCAGMGCGSPAFCRSLTKCCCYRCNCESKEGTISKDHEGCCQNICSCCFFHCYCQCPCRPGMPRCVCCNEQMMCCGHLEQHANEHHGEAGGVPMFEYLLFESCTCAYCCCMGCSCKSELISCFKLAAVCCGCRCLCEEAMPECGPDGLCTCLLTCARCYGQCSIPRKKEFNPCIACCGKRCKKVHPTHLGVGLGQNKKKKSSLEVPDDDFATRDSYEN